MISAAAAPPNETIVSKVSANGTHTYLMRQPHRKPTEFLSRKYDLSDYQDEELHWDFYDSYNRCIPTTTAIAAGETSIENFRLDKYVKLSSKKPPQLDVQIFPEPFDKLIPLQTKFGKWLDPIQVRKILKIPTDVVLNNTSSWEEATAFALAAMRIRCDLFDILSEYHDKAIGLIADKSLLYRAAHIVGERSMDIRDQVVHDRGESDKQLAIEMEADKLAIIPRFTHQNQDHKHQHNSENGVRTLSTQADDVYDSDISAATSITVRTYAEDKPYDFSLPKGRNSTLSNTAYVSIIQLVAKNVTTDGQSNNNSIELANSPTAKSPNEQFAISPITIATPASTNKLSALLQKTHAVKDTVRIQLVGQLIDDLKMKIITCMTKIDKHIAMIQACVKECARNYSHSELFAQRNVQFGRLTAMLGDGFVARPGLDDWRSVGVEGYRPLVIALMNHMYRLAQARILIEELQEPERLMRAGEATYNLINFVVSVDTIRSCSLKSTRWNFLWDGEDVITKVLHNLDFLRTSAELSEWYGRTFHFCANPLMLPLPMDREHVIDPLNMLGKIQQELATELFEWKSPRDLTTDWQYQGYLGSWANDFQEACHNRHSFNWPNIPDIRETSDRDAIYISMLMLYCQCFDDILDTVIREKEFISLAGTHRGSHLLHWEAAGPPQKHKKFVVPDVRKANPIENVIGVTMEKRREKLNRVPGDSGSSLSVTSSQEQRDREANMKAYNEMIQGLMAANPVKVSSKPASTTTSAKGLSLHKLQQSAASAAPISRPARHSKLIIGTSLNIAIEKQRMNVTNFKDVRAHAEQTLTAADLNRVQSAPEPILYKPVPVAVKVIEQGSSADTITPARMKSSTIRMPAGSLPPLLNKQGTTPVRKLSTSVAGSSTVRLRADTMYNSKLNTRNTTSAGSDRITSADIPPTTAEVKGNKRQTNLTSKLTMLSNVLTSVQGDSGVEPMRSVITRVPRASIVNDTVKLTRRTTVAKR